MLRVCLLKICELIYEVVGIENSAKVFLFRLVLDIKIHRIGDCLD